MREAVVVATARTPLAKSFRGSLNMTRPDDMAAHCLRTVLERAPALAPAKIADVILGCGERTRPVRSATKDNPLLALRAAE